MVDAENGLLYNRTAVQEFPLPFCKVNIFLYDFEAVSIKERVSICELTAILLKIIRTSSNREVLYGIIWRKRQTTYSEQALALL